MAVVLSHLVGIGEDLKLLHKAKEPLNTRMINLKFKIENIEIKVEAATVVVLKEVFGLRDLPTPMAEGVAEQEHHGPELNLEPGQTSEASQEDKTLGKMESSG